LDKIEETNWDDLIVGLDRALNAAKKLRAFYNGDENSGVFHLEPNSTYYEMLTEIAQKNGGKLITKDAKRIINANLHSACNVISSNIFVTLRNHSEKFRKLGKGVYQLNSG
jgi:hypothetical protein